MTDTTTNTTEHCYTCGGDFNCPDCGVWLTREDYEFAEARAWTLELAAPPPALTRILSEEAAPAPVEAAPAEAAPQADAHIQLYREAQGISNRNPNYPHAIAWHVDGSIRVASFKHGDRISGVIKSLPMGTLYVVYSPDESGASVADTPAPADPRDAEIAALKAEVAAFIAMAERATNVAEEVNKRWDEAKAEVEALRDMRQRIITHAEGVLRYENVGPTEFFRGACGAYKTVLGIINTTNDTRTNSTPVES